MSTVSAEELLAGSELTHAVEIPAGLLGAGSEQDAAGAPAGSVVLRPVTVADLQHIGRAARDDDALSSALLIQQGLVEPALTLTQVQRLPAGLAEFLVATLEDISGIATTTDALGELVQAPLARACFVLAREFGWTPEQVSGLTIGQILLFLQMSGTEGSGA
jgi:hypothetical protein